MEPSARLRLRVTPGARRSEIVGRHGDAWKLRVAAAPQRGRANEAVARLLAGVLGVRPDAVEIVAGHSGQDKQVAVTGIAQAHADAQLEAAARDRAGAAAGVPA